MRANIILCLATIALVILASLPALAQRPATDSEPHLVDCTVSLIEDRQFPALVSGAISKLHCKEGRIVKAGEVLAQIDNSKAAIALDLAAVGARQAAEKYDSAIPIEYAQAQADVAEAVLEKALIANRKTDGAIPKVEVLRLKLDHKRSLLQVKQEKLNKKLERHDVDSSKMEYLAARKDMQRHQVVSTIAGVVASVLPGEGEWVAAGDPVVRVVSLRRLRVDGFVNIRDHTPGEIRDRRVTVTVRLAGGKPVRFEGIVTFVAPEAQASGEYRVKAEVENRQSDGDYLLRPGLVAEMTIHTQTKKIAARKGK